MTPAANAVRQPPHTSRRPHPPHPTIFDHMAIGESLAFLLRDPDPTDATRWRISRLPDCGERRFCRALLESAIHDLFWIPPRRRPLTSDERRLRELARQWIASGATDLGSFAWACEAVGIDPTASRAALLREHEGAVVPHHGRTCPSDRTRSPRIDAAASVQGWGSVRLMRENGGPLGL